MQDEQTPPKPEDDAPNAATLAAAMRLPKLLRAPVPPLPVPLALDVETHPQLH